MRSRILWWLMVVLSLSLAACKAGPPAITSFAAAKSPITLGTSTTLTAVFSNGNGTIDQGVGAVSSGQSVTISPLADTTYTLTVKGDAGTVTKTASVTVVNPPLTPVITAPTAIAPGQTSTASVPSQTGCTYGWTISGGTITAGSGTAQITFRANAASPAKADSQAESLENLILTCIATNSAGTASESASATIPIGARPPVITSVSFADMYEGCSGHIYLYATDPHGGNLTYDFQQTGGPLVSQIEKREFHCFFVTPKVAKDEVVTFKVEATNSLGLKAEKSVSTTLIYSGPWTLDLKLHPMPTSVLLDPGRMGITRLGLTSNANVWGGGFSTIRFTGNGDINGDGREDLIIAGWTTGGSNPPAQVFFLMSTASGYIIKEGKDMGIENVPGSTLPTIYDFNGDGKKDIFFPGFTDAPCITVPSVMALQQADGTFVKTSTVEKICSHMGDFVDINRDGRPDFILPTYPGTGGGLSGLVYYENTGGGLKLHLTSTAPSTITYLGGSSATAGDFHKTGVPTIINGDVSIPWGDVAAKLKNVVEVSNMNWGSDGNLVSATQTQFMTPFFHRDPRFARAFSTWGDMKSHNICIRVLDLDADGYQDFVMASMIWSGIGDTDYAPNHSIINIVRGTATGFSDETESRLWNYQVTRRQGHHILRVIDLNGDGKPDLLGTDGGYWNKNGQIVPYSAGNEVLLNDGAGNLVSIFREGFDALRQRAVDMVKTEPSASVYEDNGEDRFFPLLGPNRELRWLTAVPFKNTVSSTEHLAWYLVDAGTISTGPNLQDPTALGIPGFSELYYLTHNPDVLEMVMRGEYSSGLEHYLAQGRKEERKPRPRF